MIDYFEMFKYKLKYSLKHNYDFISLCMKQERSQKGDSGCASEKLGVPHVLSDKCKKI